MARFRSNDYWQPLDALYRRLPDYGHPLTERFAFDLHYHTRFCDISDLPAGAKFQVWEQQPVEVREFFRNRARALMRGDLSVVPTHLPPGYGAWQAVTVSPLLVYGDAPEPVLGWDWT